LTLSLYLNFTFSFWVKPTAPTTACEIINRGRDNDGAFISRFVSGQFQVASNSTSVIYTDPSLYNQWSHYLITRIGNTLTIYRNGVAVNSGSFANPINLAPQFWIGRHNEQGNGNGSTYSFVGYLDDIRMYNRALTQSEITYLATH